jgi:hypothetical protein
MATVKTDCDLVWASLKTECNLAKASVKTICDLSAAAAWAPNGAAFDGSNCLEKTATTITGLADAATFTLSFWAKFGAGGNDIGNFLFTIQAATTVKLICYKAVTTNRIHIQGKDSAAVNKLLYNGTAAYTGGTAWRHFLILGSTAADAGNKMYVNGNAVTWTKDTRAVADLDFVGTNFNYRVGARAGTTRDAFFYGEMAELWFSTEVVDDPTAFGAGASSGAPIDIGADGAGASPTDTKPAFYLSRAGSASLWITDSANGNNYSEYGTLGALTSTISY